MWYNTCMLKLPYAIRDFYALITEDYFYIDRTDRISVLENLGKELLFLRPRRMGKSLWLSTLMNYYDVAKADEFERLFGHLAVGQAPTPLRNQYLVMKWDFSTIRSHGSIDQIEKDLLYIMDSESAIQGRYGDLIMMIRPEMRHYSVFDLLIEFKFVPLSKLKKLTGEDVRAKHRGELVKLSAVKAELAQAQNQLRDYRKTLDQKYGEPLKLRTYAVVAVSFERLIWEEITE